MEIYGVAPSPSPSPVQRERVYGRGNGRGDCMGKKEEEKHILSEQNTEHAKRAINVSLSGGYAENKTT